MSNRSSSRRRPRRAARDSRTVQAHPNDFKIVPPKMSVKDLPPEAPKPWTSYLGNAAAISKFRDAGLLVNPFTGLPMPPPGVVPKGYRQRKKVMAADNQIFQVNSWAAEGLYNGAFFNGIQFMGYTYLAELAQRPEYRRFAEVTATEMTRRWIRIQSKSTDRKARESKTDRIKQLEAEMERLDVQGCFRKMVELDGFFGRAHLYLDTGDTDKPEELMTSIGNGSNGITKLKFRGRKGYLKALKAVEPVWTYPAMYNAIDPLKDDWYKPQSWLVQGKELHHTRLLTFVGREVPDLLKPSYSFGGLSLSQMAKPYVDNWLRQRTAIGDLVVSFTQWILSTDLAALLAADGSQLFDRATLFSNLKNNQGMMMINKDSEEFSNVTAPLGGLDSLQAQSQEHMCSVVGIPVVKLLGIQPAGLNASSEGELTTWYEWVEAYQEKFFTEKLHIVLDHIQMSLWGEVDQDITFSYEPLRVMSAKEKADLRKADAEAGASLIDHGVISPEEERARIAADPDTPYQGLEVEDVPAAAPMEEEEGDYSEMADLLTPLGQMGSMNREDEQRRAEPSEGRRNDDDTASPRRNDADQDRTDRSRGSRPREPRTFDA